MKKKFIGNCKLCLTENIELCDSHIISELFYKRIGYDHLHQIYVHVPYPNRKYKRILQKGETEKLLCIKCEGIIGKYETYAANYLDKLRSLVKPEYNVDIPVKVNYTKFKLFVLSLFWRASVSQSNNLCDLYKHENSIREMILHGDAGESYDYGIMIYNIHTNYSPINLTQIISQCLDVGKRIHGHKAFRFLGYGFGFLLFVSSHLKEAEFKQLFIQKIDRMVVVSSKPENINDIIKELVKNTEQNTTLNKILGDE